MRIWKINCMEDAFPGMWQRWYRHQCVGIGWCANWGYRLKGKPKEYAWSRARNAVLKIEVGDIMVVALKGHRVGRIGQVTGKAILDQEWDPLVPPSRKNKDGEIGRRIFVRWDMVNAPDDRDRIVLLPPKVRFTAGELRPTLCEVNSKKTFTFKSRDE